MEFGSGRLPPVTDKLNNRIEPPARCGFSFGPTQRSLRTVCNETIRVPRLCEPCRPDTRLTPPWHSMNGFVIPRSACGARCRTQMGDCGLAQRAGTRKPRATALGFTKPNGPKAPTGRDSSPAPLGLCIRRGSHSQGVALGFRVAALWAKPQTILSIRQRSRHALRRPCQPMPETKSGSYYAPDP